MTNTIDPSLYLDNYHAQRNNGTDVLGKDAFLKILMAQLQNQDPLNPMEDKDFIAQMAQFSTLEQMMNLGKSFDRFALVQEQNMLISYNQFVGKEVTWHKITGEEDEDGMPIVQEGTGVVTSIQFTGSGDVVFVLEDGTKLDPGNISQVNYNTGESSLVQASMMIGKTVTWTVGEGDEKEEIEATVQSVSLKNGKIVFQLDDADNTEISASQIIKVQ